MNDILNYLKPELLVLIPVCWGIGLVLKSTKIPRADASIPAALAATAVALATLYLFGEGMIPNVALGIFAGVTQGIIAWLMAWVSYEKGIKTLQNKEVDNG